MSVGLLLVAVVLLAANGVFVALEFSLIASRRTKLEQLRDEGGLSARLAYDAASELPLQLASVQLGVTMCSLGLGAVAEQSVAEGLKSLFDLIGGLPDGVADSVAVVIGLGVILFLHTVVGEMVPRYLSLADPERTLLRLAVFSRVFVFLFRPLIRGIRALGNGGTRLFGFEPRSDLATVHNAEEIASMLAASREEGLIAETAHDLLTGALDFGERPLSSVMVPRERIVSVTRDATVTEAEQLIVASGHSRLLVVGTDLDDIVGFVHAKDLLTVPQAARQRPLPLARIRRVLLLQHDRALDEVLVVMRRSRTHVGVVVDGKGRMCGLATLEDVLEQLVGEIEDESDTGRRRVTPPRRRVTR
jgi:CBS domain containing-hemolysin-like protein